MNYEGGVHDRRHTVFEHCKVVEVQLRMWIWYRYKRKLTRGTSIISSSNCEQMKRRSQVDGRGYVAMVVERVPVTVEHETPPRKNSLSSPI